jgi:hypothetical protein
LVEHHLAKVDVESSSLFARSISRKTLGRDAQGLSASKRGIVFKPGKDARSEWLTNVVLQPKVQIWPGKTSDFLTNSKFGINAVGLYPATSRQNPAPLRTKVSGIHYSPTHMNA